MSENVRLQTFRVSLGVLVFVWSFLGVPSVLSDGFVSAMLSKLWGQVDYVLSETQLDPSQ